MKYNPQLHHRRSIRLKGYDYSQAGLYFITIVTQNRAHLFGDIRRGEPSCSPKTCSPGMTLNHPEMNLNDAGMMIEKWYHELENKFHDIRCHTMIIMPNHFHCIIENIGESKVRADLCVCPKQADLCVCPANNIHNWNLNIPNWNLNTPNCNHLGENELLDEYAGSPLHRVIQWLKTMTTNEYIRGVKTLGWKPFHGRLWQRNYWEYIIRNEQEYQRISNYIINNPRKWNNKDLKST